LRRPLPALSEHSESKIGPQAPCVENCRTVNW